MRKIRYAVAGLGHISQNALLPAFANTKNSELAALITGDEEKRKKIAELYGLKPSATYSYEQFDDCMRSGDVDAVYIGLPNKLHCEYTVRAAKAGIHVLCEKPMALNERECLKMIAACEGAGVKLMIAYRLHFEEANLEAIRLATSGELGALRIFSSAFTQQVAENNTRLEEPESQGGGSLFDMGVYCINASRYLFRDEPTEVMAISVSNGDKRFRKVPEMTSVTMRFPSERLANFVASFGAAPVSEYSLAGTRGSLRMSPAYDYQKPLAYELLIDGAEPKRKEFRKRDQFGAELEYFSRCIENRLKPEPSGEEGLADIRIVQAILESARTRAWVKVKATDKPDRPTEDQKINKPPVKPKQLVDASSPSGKS